MPKDYTHIWTLCEKASLAADAVVEAIGARSDTDRDLFESTYGLAHAAYSDLARDMDTLTRILRDLEKA